MLDKGNILIKNISSKNIEQEIKTKNDKKLKDACRDFEAYFLDMVLEELRKGSPGNALFPESNAKKIYEYMYYNALTKEAVKGQSLGISDLLYNYLKQFEK